MQNIRTIDYWNNRVKNNKHNLRDLIFLDRNRDEYWRRVDNLLSLYKHLKVLDVCCGYGRFSNFKNYTGIDFSPEMIKLAKEKNPNKVFKLANALEYFDNDKYDLVFEVNSLHSLGLTADEFFKKFKKNATKYILCLEKDFFNIYNIY